jgi:Ca2+-dependent lipid-binding protein
MRTTQVKAQNSLLSRPISLVAQSLKSTIYVNIIRARNLISKDIGGTSDPYVTVTIGPFTAKTSTRRRNLNPEWNESFSFQWNLRDTNGNNALHAAASMTI